MPVIVENSWWMQGFASLRLRLRAIPDPGLEMGIVLLLLV